jgi:hypothetical protein
MEAELARKKSRIAPRSEGGADQEYIYRAWITTRDGRRLYAKTVGKTAFKIPKRY